MKVKLKDILVWVAIFILAVYAFTAADADYVDDLESRVAQLEKGSESFKEVINKTSIKSSENRQEIIKNIELIEKIYKCNPYCTRPGYE